MDSYDGIVEGRLEVGGDKRLFSNEATAGDGIRPKPPAFIVGAVANPAMYGLPYLGCTPKANCAAPGGAAKIVAETAWGGGNGGETYDIANRLKL